jgi:hypothetical protein
MTDKLYYMNIIMNLQKAKDLSNKQVEELFAREQTSRTHRFESAPNNWVLIDKSMDEVLNK